jgi:hypothetical protein
VHQTVAEVLKQERQSRGVPLDVLPWEDAHPLETVASDALGDGHQVPSWTDAGRELPAEHQVAGDAEISADHEPVIPRDAELAAGLEPRTDLPPEPVGVLVQEAPCKQGAAQFAE